MLMRGALAVVLTLGLTSLVACYETSDVTMAEPGQYKGSQDPLLQQQASARDEALQKRFDLVQTDR